MHNYDAGRFGGSAESGASGRPDNDGPHRNSIFSLIVMIVLVAAVAAIGLTITFWALGFLFHLAGWILRIAVLAAVAAYIWRRVNRRWSQDRV
jgi:hypothetical protein